jgi:tetratricopeptide (TPR) repeat protein
MKYLPAWVLLMATAVACGDVLILDDGSRVEGKAHKQGDQWIVTDSTGHETAVDPGRIKSFQLTGSASGPAAAQDRLATLRTSVENLSDIHEIIDRYNRFIKQSGGSPLVAAAQDDLAMWQRRLDDDYKKIGGRWLTPMERQVLAGNEAQAAATIGDMIRHGQNEQAMAALNRALTDDPDDPSALYLRGILLYQNGEVPSARTDFEHVAKTMGDHAPTQNNLGVVLWRQQLFGAAMGAYLKAMIARPLDLTIVNNVAEAVHSIPPDYQSSVPAQRAIKMFADQEKELEKSQEANGLYRWGSGWVSADRLAKLSTEKAANESQLASLHAQEDQVLTSLASNQAQINSTQAEINLYSPPSPTGYGTGHGATVPPDFYFVQQDMVNLNNVKAVETEKLIKVREQIKKVEQNYSVVEFTGVQKLFGPEGTPIRTEQVAPATQP